MEEVIVKDYFYTLYDNFLLNLGCNVSGCLSIQNEITCFSNSLGLLLNRFVTSNVAMSVLGSICSGMEFKKFYVVLNITFLFHLGKVVVRCVLVC